MRIIPVILIIAGVVIGIFIGLNYFNSYKESKESTEKVSSSPQLNNLKTFKSSSVMKFAIDAPQTFQVEEKLGSVNIYTPKGQILIGQNATNFDTLDEYIDNSNNNIKSRISDKRELEINGLKSIAGNLENERSYFIYSNNTVFILSTKEPSLYPDLDQIAQSFRYTP